jgi:hypothetical protein
MTPAAADVPDRLQKHSNSRHVVVGPLVWRPTDGTCARR